MKGKTRVEIVDYTVFVQYYKGLFLYLLNDFYVANDAFNPRVFNSSHLFIQEGLKLRLGMTFLQALDFALVNISSILLMSMVVPSAFAFIELGLMLQKSCSTVQQNHSIIIIIKRMASKIWKLPTIVGSNSVSATAAAAKAMAELGSAACIGAGCVHQDLLTRPMVASLSKTTFGILLPMFLGTSIMKTIEKYGLRKSSLAGPILGVLHPFLLYHISLNLILPLFGVDCDSEDGRCAAVCSAWGNTSVVPLIFVESLFRNNPERKAASYGNIALYLVGWSPFFWSYGQKALLGDTAKSGNGSTAFLSKARSVFSPPVTGVSIGLILALIPSIRKLVMGPLRTTFTSFETFGRAASPLSLLVLTSSLALNVGVGGNSAPDKAGGRSADIDSAFVRQWMCVALTRFVISPLVVFGLLQGLLRVGLIPDATVDPILWFISILQGCMPSAQNLVLMLQVANKPEKSGEIASFLFFVYTSSMVPIVLIVSMALQHFGLA